jgi:hypothetical protein
MFVKSVRAVRVRTVSHLSRTNAVSRQCGDGCDTRATKRDEQCDASKHRRRRQPLGYASHKRTPLSGAGRSPDVRPAARRSCRIRLCFKDRRSVMAGEIASFRSSWAPSYFADTSDTPSSMGATQSRRAHFGSLRCAPLIGASMRGRCGCVERPGRLLSPENRPGRRDAPGWSLCRRAAAPLGPDLAECATWFSSTNGTYL